MDSSCGNGCCFHNSFELFLVLLFDVAKPYYAAAGENFKKVEPVLGFPHFASGVWSPGKRVCNTKKYKMVYNFHRGIIDKRNLSADWFGLPKVNNGIFCFVKGRLLSQ